MSTQRARIQAGVAAALLALAAAGTTAQTGPPPAIILDEVDRMDFDRPESWALKYFASVSMMTGMGVPKPIDYGAIELGLEGGWIPSLSEDQRRVGFVGNKVEDINRNSVYGRLRATFGLPNDFSVTLGYSPPVRTSGVEAQLFNLAVARPVFETNSWRLGLRLHGQKGDVEGDFTCPSDIAGIDDPNLNPEDCAEGSSDEVSLDYVGLELSAAPKIWGERWEPYLAVSANYMDLAFQVDARYSIFVDRTLLLTDGWTWSLAGGVGYRWTDKLGVTGELFYTPLDVVRNPSAGSENDGLFNARFLLAYVIR